jgi:hypothetical protein
VLPKPGRAFTMPADPPSNTGSPDRSRPTASELSKETTEGDLWNLDDEPAERPSTRPTPPPAAGNRNDDADPAAPKSVQRGKTAPRAPERKPGIAKEPDESASGSPHDEIGDLDESQDLAAEEAVLVVVNEDTPDSASPSSSLGFRDEAVEPPAESAPRQNRPRPPAPVAISSGGFHFPKPSPRELIGLGAFAFVVALGAIWVITRFFTQLSFEDAHVSPPDFPVRGQHVTIRSADTFWREPIREGPNRDSAKREATMIPVVEITLDAEVSALGALWVTFKNQDGETVGDPMIRSFKSGSFQPAGSSTLAIAATDGFSAEGAFNAYRTSDERPWTVEVREGPSADGGSASFKPLTVIPILPLRR